MVESESGERIKEKAPGRTSIVDPGPKRGRTCYVQRADRIKVKVEVGFGISATVDVGIKNLKLDGDRDEGEAIKSCLVVLIGGHNIIVSEVEESRSGVYPVRLFARCKGVPAEFKTLDFGGKRWIDVGDYLTQLREKSGLNPEVVKHDIAAWKG